MRLRGLKRLILCFYPPGVPLCDQNSHDREQTNGEENNSNQPHLNVLACIGIWCTRVADPHAYLPHSHQNDAANRCTEGYCPGSNSCPPLAPRNVCHCRSILPERQSNQREGNGSCPHRLMPTAGTPQAWACEKWLLLPHGQDVLGCFCPSLVWRHLTALLGGAQKEGVLA